MILILCDVNPLEDMMLKYVFNNVYNLLTKFVRIAYHPSYYVLSMTAITISFVI